MTFCFFLCFVIDKLSHYVCWVRVASLRMTAKQVCWWRVRWDYLRCLDDGSTLALHNVLISAVTTITTLSFTFSAPSLSYSSWLRHLKHIRCCQCTMLAMSEKHIKCIFTEYEWKMRRLNVFSERSREKLTTWLELTREMAPPVVDIYMSFQLFAPRSATRLFHPIWLAWELSDWAYLWVYLWFNPGSQFQLFFLLIF